jgi:hypothetical protein
MDKHLYVNEALSQLLNNKYYIPIHTPLTPSLIPKINAILTQLLQANFITHKQLNFLKPPPPPYTTRPFYILPKIHKPIHSWPHPSMPQSRPIVSDSNSPTYNVSKFIDYFVKPLSNRHPSYLKDTYDFVDKVRHSIVPPNSVLVTGDITSLYTNMHHHRIMDTVKSAFRSNPDPYRPDKHILRLLLLLLKNNDFTFNNQLYRQILGATMGFAPSPSLANIYLIPFDTAATTGFHLKPIFYYRFLDDTSFVWIHSLEELTDFNNFLNAIIPDIKVTLNIRHSAISFLDTIIYKSLTPTNQTQLLTRIYFKTTDTHQLLHTTSNHPPHCAKGILKSQLIRFKRVSSSKLDYDSACKILYNVIKDRGYTRTTFRQLKSQVWNEHQPICPNDKHCQDNTIFPVVTYYDRVSYSFNKLLISTIKTNPIFTHTRLISALKNHPNLKTHLIRSRL